MLYSYQGSRPAPLPFRITLPDGFTRTDPNTFTDDEIVAAGFTGPFTEPNYDPTTQQLDWVGGSYVISPLLPPPPPPRWSEFTLVVMADAAVNDVLGSIMRSAPGIYGGLVIGLQQVSQDDSSVFLNSWHIAYLLGLIPDDLVSNVKNLASSYDLPKSFIDGLQPRL